MPAILAKEQTDFWGISGGVRVDWKTLISNMGLAIFILLICWCFIALPVLWWMGKVDRLTLFFWIFYGLSTFFNALVINTLDGDSALDEWMCWVGPVLVFLPFACMLFMWESKYRKPVIAALISFLGSFPVTALWLLTSIMFMS